MVIKIIASFILFAGTNLLKNQSPQSKTARAVFRHDTAKTDPLESAPRVELLKLADCKHSPHLEKPLETFASIQRFCALYG